MLRAGVCCIRVAASDVISLHHSANKLNGWMVKRAGWPGRALIPFVLRIHGVETTPFRKLESFFHTLTETKTQFYIFTKIQQSFRGKKNMDNLFVELV